MNHGCWKTQQIYNLKTLNQTTFLKSVCCKCSALVRNTSSIWVAEDLLEKKKILLTIVWLENYWLPSPDILPCARLLEITRLGHICFQNFWNRPILPMNLIEREKSYKRLNTHPNWLEEDALKTGWEQQDSCLLWWPWGGWGERFWEWEGSHRRCEKPSLASHHNHHLFVSWPPQIFPKTTMHHRVCL